jgi:hypothetical protein
MLREKYFMKHGGTFIRQSFKGASYKVNINLSINIITSSLLGLQSFFLLWRCDPTRVMASSFLRFLDHTQLRSTVGRTPLKEWSAHRRDLYLITHNTHNRQTFMTPVEFEPTISAGERPQTNALDRAATGTGRIAVYVTKVTLLKQCHIIDLTLV